MIRVPTPREKHSVIKLYDGQLAALVTAGATDALEIGAYPSGSVQVIFRTGATGSVTVQEANEDTPEAWGDVGAAITASALRPFVNGARYTRVKATSGTGGIVVIVNMALQN